VITPACSVDGSVDPFANLPIIKIGSDPQPSRGLDAAIDNNPAGARIAAQYGMPLTHILATLALLALGNDEPEVEIDTDTGGYVNEDLDVLRTCVREFRYAWVPGSLVSFKALATMANADNMTNLLWLRDVMVAHESDPARWFCYDKPVSSRTALLQHKLATVRDCWHEHASTEAQGDGRNKLTFAVEMLAAASCGYTADEIAANASALVLPDLLAELEATPGVALSVNIF